MPTPPPHEAPEERPALRCLSGDLPEWAGPPAVPSQRGGAGAAAADLVTQLTLCDRRLGAAQRAVREHARHCERNRLPVDRPVLARLMEAIGHARARIAQERPLLAESADEPGLLSAGELVLRFGIATYGYARDALEWCAPASAQAHAVQFFDLAPQRTPVPAHARRGEASAAEVERQTASLLGVPDTHVVSAVSSGQAAYTLVEAVLLRERLRQGDLVVTAPTLHREAVEQLASLPFVRTVALDGHTADAVVEAAVRYRPRCLFLAPLGATARQRMLDVGAVLRRLAVVAPITVVVDGTTMSGALPGALLADAAARGVEVIYYESASASLQLGLDTATAGIVAHPVDLRTAFARQRAATGTVLYRHGADRFPRYPAELHRRRMLRVGRNARHLARALAENPAVTDAGVVCHPTLPEHPDHRLARTLPHAGGCVTFWFHRAPRNRIADLDDVCAHILANARTLGVQLTCGAGFGFAVPRLGVVPADGGLRRGVAVPDDDRPGYLRLSVGDRANGLSSLTDAVAAALSDAVADAFAG